MPAAAQEEDPGLKPTLIQSGLFVGLKPHANPERLFQQPLNAPSAALKDAYRMRQVAFDCIRAERSPRLSDRCLRQRHRQRFFGASGRNSVVAYWPASLGKMRMSGTLPVPLPKAPI